MRFSKLFSSLLVLSLLTSACGNLRIKTEMPYQPDAKVKKIALVAVYLNPPVLPETPAGDATAFNRKLEANKKEIHALFTNEVEKLTNELGMGLEAQLGITTDYGLALKDGKGYDRLASKSEKEALKVKNEIFSEILISDGSLSLLEFDEGQVIEYLEESPRLRSQVRSLSKSLQAELIAYANVQLVVDKVQRFGEKANIRLLVDIYLFDDQGKMVGQSYGETEPFIITGSEAKELSVAFEAYPVLQNLILTDLQKVDE
tara:strand:+ start:19389 stop:20165 length:777 start_codon:yes stop_codon:yes gene_type:complete